MRISYDWCVFMTITNQFYVDKLVAVGLNKYEALAYLALLEKNSVAAIDVANRSGIPKQRIYDVLDNLRAKGICSVSEGRPRCYTVYYPQQALTALLNYRKQQQAAENERQTRLISELILTLNTISNGENGESSPLAHNDDNVVDTYRDIGGF